MARLIDAEPILMKWNTESLGRKEMYDMVKNAPTIDAVPVVMCKDCFLYGECQAAKFYGDDGYCSCGKERR